MPARYDLRIKCGDSFARTFTCKNGGVAADCTGKTLVVTLASSPEVLNPLRFEKAGDATGAITVTLTRTQTREDITPGSGGRWTFELSSGPDDSVTLVEGAIVAEADWIPND